MPKWVGANGDFRHSRSSEQHSDGCIWLAKYDFLLVLIVALGPEPLSSYKSLESTDRNPKKKDEEEEQRRGVSIDPLTPRDAATYARRAKRAINFRPIAASRSLVVRRHLIHQCSVICVSTCMPVCRTQLWAVQKRMNRSRCRLACELRRAQGAMN